MSRRAAVDPASRLLSGIGLAARAGRLKVGYEAVSAAIKRGEAAAIVVAADAPAGVIRKVERITGSRSIPRVTVLNGDRLGRSLGRQRVVVLAVTDESLGRQVIDLAEEIKR